MCYREITRTASQCAPSPEAIQDVIRYGILENIDLSEKGLKGKYMEQSMNELMNHTADLGQAKMFSKAWYNEYFRRAVDSPTHSRFCAAVYGKDLCQHGTGLPH